MHKVLLKSNYNENYDKQSKINGIKNEKIFDVKKDLSKPEKEKILNSLEDKAHNCNAYLKIKTFFAKQIIEMERKIEEKDSFIMASTIKINRLTDIIEKTKKKFFQLIKNNRTLKRKNKNLKKIFNRMVQNNFESNVSHLKKNETLISENTNNYYEKECFDLTKSEDINNLSLSLKDYVESFYSLEMIEKNRKLDEEKKNGYNKNIINNILDENDYDDNLCIRDNSEIKIKLIREINSLKKRIKNNKKIFFANNEGLNNEISFFKKRNLKLNAAIKIKNSIIDKLENQNILILNELIEVLHSLRTMDIKILNRIFLDNLITRTREDLETINISSCLGIKYNILSAQSYLSYLINNDKDNKNKKNDKILKLRKIKNLTNTSINLKEDTYFEEYKKNNLLFDKYLINYKYNEINENAKKTFEKNPNKTTIKSINKNFKEDFNLKKYKKNDVKKKRRSRNSSNNNTSDIEKYSIINDSSLDEYLDSLHDIKKNNPWFIYETENEEKKVNYFKNVKENQNKIINKIMNVSIYEEELNRLIENNLKKTKLLSFYDSE